MEKVPGLVKNTNESCLELIKAPVHGHPRRRGDGLLARVSGPTAGLGADRTWPVPLPLHPWVEVLQGARSLEGLLCPSAWRLLPRTCGWHGCSDEWWRWGSCSHRGHRGGGS